MNDVTPVTPERLRTTFTQLGWGVSPRNDSPSTLQGHFDGFSVLVPTDTLPVLTIAAMGIEIPVPREQFQKALQWAEKRNEDTYLGTVGVHLPDEGPARIGASVSIPVEAGADDEQLRHFVEVAVSCSVAALRDFAKDFDLTPSPFSS